MAELQSGWTYAEALEAHFGKYRVMVNGVDYRGFYNHEDANRLASAMPNATVRPHREEVVPSGPMHV